MHAVGLSLCSSEPTLSAVSIGEERGQVGQEAQPVTEKDVVQCSDGEGVILGETDEGWCVEVGCNRVGLRQLRIASRVGAYRCCPSEAGRKNQGRIFILQGWGDSSKALLTI